jgi:anhydro-N-acetylmuramic acid kinase
VRQLQRAAPVAVLNVGGVANITYVDGEELIARDIGPGDALLDDFLRLNTGEPLDYRRPHPRPAAPSTKR